MRDRENDPRIVYAEIIDLPHWDSPKHPRMSMLERAAQFAPYAALVGYGDMVKEEARETGRRTDLSEDEADELSRDLARIEEKTARNLPVRCAITYFVPDEKKAGGETVTVTETVKRIDPVRRRIVLAGKKERSGANEEILLEDVIRIREADPEPAVFP